MLTIELESRLRCLIAFFFCICFAVPSQADIVIGVAGPLSGQNASFGNELRVGATAAINAINAQGGINGEKLALIEGDDGCDAKRAIEVAKNFASRDVRMVVGHFCTSASLAAAATYLNAGILMMNVSVTQSEMTSKNLWNVFRLTGRDDAQAEIAAKRIKAEGKSSEVYLITDGQIETAALANRFQANVPNTKIAIVKPGAATLPDDPGLITASAIYLTLQPIDAAEIIRELRNINPTVSIYGPDVLQSESFGSKAIEASNGTHITFLRDNITLAKATVSNTLATTDGATLAAYAAIETFVAAAKGRDVNDARAMANWLSAGNAAATVIGSLKFNAAGDLQDQPYVWYQWKDGNLVAE